jgi:ABC-2 type transport system ATP-binding protein
MNMMIEAHELTKRYSRSHRDKPALDGIELSIEKGHLYGLIGPDGAGKTTCIRILATVMVPTSGSVRLAGFDVVRQAEHVRTRLGYMPQAFSLYPDLTVLENLRFFANLNGVSPAKQNARIEELLGFAGLTDFTSRRGRDLSGGMQKKLALACALVHEPEILLLDEPTTGVDPVSRRQLWHLLAKVVHQGVTVLVSTPYMDEAERCHQVSIINNGRILDSRTPTELEERMPFRIVEVKAKPRKTLRQVVGETEGVLGWRAVGDRLRLAVANQAEVQERIGAELEKAGAQVSILRAAQTEMEDVFIHLAEEREKQA